MNLRVTSFNYFQARWGLSISRLVEGAGWKAETARHFVCTCRALRTRHLGDFYATPEEQFELELAKVVSFVAGSESERPARLFLRERAGHWPFRFCVTGPSRALIDHK